METPLIQDLETPNISTELNLEGDVSFLSDEAEENEIGSNSDIETAENLLRKIRVKDANRIIIGTLNINSLAPKFEQLKEVIGKNIDILTIQETKLDSSFPVAQFLKAHKPSNISSLFNICRLPIQAPLMTVCVYS